MDGASSKATPEPITWHKCLWKNGSTFYLSDICFLVLSLLITEISLSPTKEEDGELLLAKMPIPLSKYSPGHNITSLTWYNVIKWWGESRGWGSVCANIYSLNQGPIIVFPWTVSDSWLHYFPGSSTKDASASLKTKTQVSFVWLYFWGRISCILGWSTNSPCHQWCSWISHLPASTSPVLGLHACTTTLAFM